MTIPLWFKFSRLHPWQAVYVLYLYCYRPKKYERLNKALIVLVQEHGMHIEELEYVKLGRSKRKAKRE